LEINSPDPLQLSQTTLISLIFPGPLISGKILYPDPLQTQHG